MDAQRMKILTLSDVQIPFLNSPQVKKVFSGADLIISCGDLPPHYLEYIVSALDVPHYFVRGNHAQEIEQEDGTRCPEPFSGANLHRRVVNFRGLLLAGVEGSLRYRKGPFQYSQYEMWKFVLELAPRLLLNRLRHGRALDVFVTHASPWGIHDQEDLPHQGIHAFVWLIKVFKPAYHFHGHIHVYHPDTVTESKVGETRVLNTYGYREIDVSFPSNSQGWNQFSGR
jgi:uncharacterized protein